MGLHCPGRLEDNCTAARVSLLAEGKNKVESGVPYMPGNAPHALACLACRLGADLAQV